MIANFGEYFLKKNLNFLVLSLFLKISFFNIRLLIFLFKSFCEFFLKKIPKLSATSLKISMSLKITGQWFENDSIIGNPKPSSKEGKTVQIALSKINFF